MISDAEIEYVEIYGKNIGESDLAVHFDDGEDTFWIPKSVMESWPKSEEDGMVMVAEWFAEKEELV